jgi:hypothetical protein
MKYKQHKDRPFLLSTTLIVLSVLALLFNAAIVYTWVFYAEAQKGLEVYLSETFVKFPFSYFFSSFSAFSFILLVSVVLMWMRKKAGLVLYFIWTFLIIVLLLFAEQIDWFNILLLLVMAIALALNKTYFSAQKEVNPLTDPKNAE